MNPTRRQFLGLLAPLAVLPVVGPHMLLSERPRSVGWRRNIEPVAQWFDRRGLPMDGTAFWVEPTTKELPFGKYWSKHFFPEGCELQGYVTHKDLHIVWDVGPDVGMPTKTALMWKMSKPSDTAALPSA